MTQYQENITDMFDTVAAYLAQHPTRWNGLKALADAVSAFEAGIAEIEALTSQQQAPIKGYRNDKAQLRAELEEALSLVADPLSAFASVHEDAVIKATADLSRSAIGAFTADNLIERARLISAAARLNLAALADYGIDADTLEEIEGAIEEFDAVKRATRTAQANRTGATATLPELIAANRTLLRDRIDKLVSSLVAKEPVFVAGYRAARVVVQRAARRSAAQPAAPAARELAPVATAAR